MRLRGEDVGLAYRDWHKRMREAWNRGAHDEAAERSVLDVARELHKRYPPGQDPITARPIWSYDMEFDAKIGGKLGAAGLGMGVEGSVGAKLKEIPASIPNKIRNWLIENVTFWGYKKLFCECRWSSGVNKRPRVTPPPLGRSIA
jgi:hypothetical protein